MWRKFFSAKFSDAVFYQPVTADAMELAQSKLGLSLPQDLRERYLETNGVYFADA